MPSLTLHLGTSKMYRAEVLASNAEKVPATGFDLSATSDPPGLVEIKLGEGSATITGVKPGTTTVTWRATPRGHFVGQPVSSSDSVQVLQPLAFISMGGTYS